MKKFDLRFFLLQALLHTARLLYISVCSAVQWTLAVNCSKLQWIEISVFTRQSADFDKKAFAVNCSNFCSGLLHFFQWIAVSCSGHTQYLA